MFLEFIFVILILLSYYSWKKHSYWQKRGIFSPPFYPLIGHAHQIAFVPNRWIKINKVYKEHSDKKFWGMYEFLRPILYVKDLELASQILVKDADFFMDRRPFSFSNNDGLINEAIPMQRGENWKNLRSLISPVFSSGKIKGMFSLTSPIADRLVKHFIQETKSNDCTDVRSAYGKYNSNVIASCVFGLELDCFDGTSDFEKLAKDFTTFSTMRSIKYILALLMPASLTKKSGIKVMENLNSLELMAKNTISEREKLGIVRGDFLDLMMDTYKECQRSENPKYPMTIDTVVAQCLLFLFAGFDTVGTSLTIATYYLAKHENVQERLRKELNNIDLDYNGVNSALYLDACFHEALRLYSPAILSERHCTRDFKIPNSNVTIEKGTLVAFPLWSYAHDNEYFEDPEMYNPDRFMPENRSTITPFSFNAFGQGPRNCLGMRFALMVSKIALAKTIIKQKITLAPGYEELPITNTAETLQIARPGVKIICEEIKD